MDVAGERLQIEADRVGKIEFSDDGDVGGVEDGGVFEGLSSPSVVETSTRRRLSPRSKLEGQTS